MKIVGYEIKKLLGIKYLWIMLLIMAVLCSGVFYFMNHGYNVVGEKIEETEDDPHAAEIKAVARTLAEKYGPKSEYLLGIEKEYNDYIIERRAVEDETMQNLLDQGVSIEDVFDEIDRILADYPPYENKLGLYYTDGEPMPDGDVVSEVRLLFTLSDMYDEYIDDVVTATERNLRRIKARGGEGTPAHEYQLHFNALYKKIDETVDITGLRPAEGWYRFFSFDMITAFVFVYLTLAAGVVFLHERSCGTLLVVRTARHGRFATVAAKLPALALLCVLSVAVFTLAVLLPCAAMYGFSDPSMPLQSCMYEFFWNCPYNISLGGGMTALFAMRCFCAFSFACIVAFAAAVFLSPPVTYGVGALVLLVNMIVNYFITYNNKIKLNLVGMSSATALTDYSEIYVFGHYRSTFAVGAVLFTSLAALSVFIVLLVGTKRKAAKSMSSPRVISRIGSAFGAVRQRIGRIRGTRASGEVRAKRNVRARVMRGPTGSLFAWECRKLLTPLTLAAIVLFAAGSALNARSYYNELPMTHSGAYDNYIFRNWFGPLTDEKYREFEERLEQADRVTSMDVYYEMRDALDSGEITSEEFAAFLTEQREGWKEIVNLRKLDENVEYLREAKEKTGVEGWIIPTDEISLLLGRSINIWRVAAVILIFARMYVPDYAGRVSEGNFASILYTTRRGRRSSFRAKMWAAFALSLALSAIFEASDFMIGVTETTNLTAMLNVPVLSVPGYDTFGNGLTVGGFLALSVLTRTVGTLLLAYLTCAASFLTKKVQAALVATSMVTLLPYALVYMGVRPLRYVDMTAVLAGGKLLTRSAEFAVFDGVYGFAIMLTLAYLIVSAAAVFCVRQRTGR